jgi:glycosyltransferase involved in cell wall biosynthesis
VSAADGPKARSTNSPGKLERAPRVTLGIATYNRHTYLRGAVASALAQDYDDFEVLVVCDGTTNPAVDAVLESFDDARLRVVRHERNLGIAAAYNTFVSAGRGELIAMIGDDDLCVSDRLRRQVELFDRYPDTGVVHGDALIIDSEGNAVGSWPSREFEPAELIAAFFRSHNHLVDPTRVVHRRVYEAVGGYSADYPIAQDFEFWLRAARTFRFRHCPGGPLVAVRRHGDNASDESARALEIADVERALESALELYPLEEIVPEVDWRGLDGDDAERAALLRLAELVEHRMLALPDLAARLRTRARPPLTARPARPVGLGGAGRRGRIVITAFGWNDSGGGTAVPRVAAKELARRGWQVSVFHAAVGELAGAGPYATREWDENGVHLVGVYNRPSVLFDLAHPEREIDDPQIAALFAQLLDRVSPDVVHFHNLHNLGASLFDHAAARGIPSFFSTHNYWLICPRAYLLTADGTICAGPGDRGGDCASCVGGHDRVGYQRRLGEIRARAERSLTACLAVSGGVRRTLLATGYSPELIDVVRQAMPQDRDIWDRVGAARAPGRVADVLTVGFIGSAYPHKGPQLLIEAAQRTEAPVRVRIHGEVPARFAEQLRSLDHRGVVELCGAFTAEELPELLASIDVAALPSLWWDCAPLAATECRAARLPLLVPRLGGLAEVVRDELDGLIFDGLDAGDLASKLDRLASDQGLLERLQSEIAPPRSFSEYIDELEAYYAGARPGHMSDDGERPAPAVRWQGDHGVELSLSIVNREVTRRLPGPVQRVGRDGRAAEGDPPLAHAADVEVRHQWPPDLRPAPSGRLAVIQPWEFGAIPRSWVGPLRENVDELWVPSDFVRQMYLGAGLEPERVVTVPNGVDIDVFTPDGERYPLEPAGAPDALRFLFHGGLIWRKGHDVLLAAWREAFAGRDDVVLVVKTVGANSVYRNGEGEGLREYAASGALPRVALVTEELSDRELASLYRACDVFVHPYRGEGFAMGVLEAMACGLPSIVTAGGPTDEFCPPTACWRIRSHRAQFPADRVDSLDTVGRPWVLEPDRDHLVELLREAAASQSERDSRAEAAIAAAGALSWDAVAERYGARLDRLARRQPLSAGPAEVEPYPLSDAGGLRLLATPAWRGADRLGELLAQWCTPQARASDASLILLADPNIDGTPGELEERVRAAAAASGCELDSAGDINLLMEPLGELRDARLHAAVDGYVMLHRGAPGHERLALAAGNTLLEPDGAPLAALLGAAAVACV